MTGKNKDKPWSRIIILAASLTGFILALYFMHRIGFHNIFSAVASIGVEGFFAFLFLLGDRVAPFGCGVVFGDAEPISAENAVIFMGTDDQRSGQ